jgi:hypothetical protein
MSTGTKLRILIFGAVAMLGAADALAVVGRPLTPISYAGVARRTARRSAYYNMAATSSYMATLPAGCVRMPGVPATYYQCGASYYRPMYQGPDVVYVVTPPP